MATPKRDECDMKDIEMSGIPHDLPQELITEILLRLPVKPLGRCKCVSKPWQSLISSPSFVNAHLKLHIHDPEDFILLDPDPNETYLLPEPTDSHLFLNILTFTSETRSEGIARTVNYPTKTKDLGRLGVSGYGLVLLVLDCRITLMNPITLEAVEDHLYRPYAWFCAYGMGYDSLKDDYTVVSISYERVVETYSLKMKTWRRLTNFPHDIASISHPAAFLNGHLHFLASSDSRTVLAAFSLASEEFEETPLPNDVEFDEIQPDSAVIMVFEGCLAFVYELEDYFKVWVMREYGVRDSWENFATIMKRPTDMEYWLGCQSGCLVGEDEIVLGCRNGFSTHNRRSGDSRKMAVSNYPHELFLGIQSFRESLLSPVTFNGSL